MAPLGALTDDAKAVICVLSERCKGVLTVAQLSCMTMGSCPLRLPWTHFRHLCIDIYPGKFVIGVECIEKEAAAGSFILVHQEGDVTLTSKSTGYIG